MLNAFRKHSYHPVEGVSNIELFYDLIFVYCISVLTSFAIMRYNKPEFTVSSAFVAGRLAACVLIVGAAAITGFNPLITLVVDTLAVYLALVYEMLLFHKRSGLVAFGHTLGYEPEELADKGYTFTTAEGRRAIEAAARKACDAGDGKRG